MYQRVRIALRHPSLKLTIIAIIFVVLLPTLGVVTAALYSASRSFYEASTQQLLETARTVARSTMSELELTANVLQHLSQLQALGGDVQLQQHKVSSFAHGVLDAHVLQRSSGTWSLTDDTDQDAATQKLVRLAAQTGRMQVSNILMSEQTAQDMRIVLAVPSTPSAQIVHVATLTTTPEHLLHALAIHGDSSQSVILAITDGEGRILERSVEGARFIGKRVPDWTHLSQQPGRSGVITAETLEGGQIIFAFQRIEGTPGWVAVVGESASGLNRRSQLPIRVMLAAGGGTIFFALLLALLLVRKALKPIRLLATRAQRIAGQKNTGERWMADVPPSFVAEFEVLRKSLDQADLVLQRSLQESRRAEQDAQEHLLVLKAAEEQARLGHWSLDVQTGALKFSEMLSVLFGDVPQPRVMRITELRAYLSSDSYDRMQAAAMQCIRNGTPYAMEVEHLRKDGSIFAAHLRGAPVFSADGQVIAITGTLQDISEGKEQRDRLAALADNLPSGVIFRIVRSGQRALQLQFLSAGLETLTGMSAHMVLQEPRLLLQAISGVHLRKLLRVLQGAQETGHVLDEQFALRTLHGQEIWIHCRAALRYPGAGGAVWDGIARDVTADRAAQAALRTAKEAAESAERAKSDFLATMSHEIRTPMNSVIGMARLAMRTDLDSKQRNYLEKINESANVLLAIINDILDFSKIEAGGLVLERVPFRLEAVLDTVAAVTALKAEEKGLEITYAMVPGLPTVVHGDALRLGQVLSNLVSNAIKFTDTGDVVVRVGLMDEGEGRLLHFSVSDSGVGLSPEQVRSLFQPFSQAQSDTSRRYGGTGLGLAICKRLVEMMGGTIGMTSELGVGSTFFFTVRLDAARTKDEAPMRDEMLRGQRILIADDNPIARTALAEMAEGFGMQATLVGNGQEALDVLQQQAACNEPFDMVVLDWHMPVMDGVAAARRIKSDDYLERMPAVLMVTAYEQDAMLQAAKGIELQGVLLKPVTQSTLFNTLRHASKGDAVHAPLKGPIAYAPVDAAAFSALKGQRVLVVDDNALNREVAADFLSHVGVQVTTAIDGQDAIRCLGVQAMDAVLMDIHMPLMDGLSATREIRRHQRWQQIPIIALTAQARTEDVWLSREAGMNGHLTKPIDELALYSMLLAHCCPDAAMQGVGGRFSEATLPAAGDALVGVMAFAHLSQSPLRRAHLLEGFLQDFEPLPQRFAALLADAQWVPLAALVHRIKGSASYLHATQLCAVADKVEAAARNGHGDAVQEYADSFIAQVHSCLAKVREALNALQSKQPWAEGTSAALTNHEVVALIEQARPLVASGNFGAQRLLEQLVRGAGVQPWANAAKAALAAVEDLEREQALQWLDAVYQQCTDPGSA